MNPSPDTRVVHSYLFFGGRCEEALDFYAKTLGAKVEGLMRFKDSPEPPPPGVLPPGFENKIMHSCLRIGESQVMASDGCRSDGSGFNGFSLSLSVSQEAEADRAFAALADGGRITMPIGPTFWSPRFGMVEDRFGVAWMVMVPPVQPS